MTCSVQLRWVGRKNTAELCIHQQKLSQADCDKKLAAMFGGSGAVAASATEPPGVRNGADYAYHLANNGVIHLYANGTGTQPSDPVGLYRPSGGRFIGGGEYEEKWTDPQGAVHHTGNYSNEFMFKYSGGLVIKFFHVGGTSGGVEGGARLGRFPNEPNRIGNIGGLGGGENPNYFHTHIEFDVNGKRTDPRKIYCGW